MILWFDLLALALCPSTVCLSGAACPWLDLDLCFYPIEPRTSSLLSSPSFSLVPSSLPLSAFILIDREPKFRQEMSEP